LDYLLVKTIHILSATLLFGTGLGSAFYKWRSDKSAELPAIAVTNKNVVLADWLFTTPAIIVQPLSGLFLSYQQGYSVTESWLLISIVLFIIAGLCWLPVVVLQIKMRDLSCTALHSHTSLPKTYALFRGIWFWLGVTAFLCIMVVYVLMVTRLTF
jgi:uncharacterized membrane protein